MDETSHISNILAIDLTVILWRIKGSGIYTQVATGLNETKKEARQVNQKF